MCVCIDYVLQSTFSNYLRALSAVPRASSNPVDLRPVVAALHRVRLRAGTRRLWRSDRAACIGRFVLRSFRGPSVSLRFIRSQGQRFLRTMSTRHTSANTRHPRRTEPPSNRYGMCTTWTTVPVHPQHAETVCFVCQRTTNKTRPMERGRVSRNAIISARPSVRLGFLKHALHGPEPAIRHGGRNDGLHGEKPHGILLVPVRHGRRYKVQVRTHACAHAGRACSGSNQPRAIDECLDDTLPIYSFPMPSGPSHFHPPTSPTDEQDLRTERDVKRSHQDDRRSTRYHDSTLDRQTSHIFSRLSSWK